MLVYFAVVSLEYGTWYFIVETFFCAIGFLVALCKMVSMFLKDLKADWHRLNQINKTGFHRKVKMKFCALVGVHSQILQLIIQNLIKSEPRTVRLSLNLTVFVSRRFVNEVTHVCQYIITSLYLWSLLSICSALLATLINMVKLNSILRTSVLAFGGQTRIPKANTEYFKRTDMKVAFDFSTEAADRTKNNFEYSVLLLQI